MGVVGSTPEQINGLVADLITATGLLDSEQVAVVRGRAASGSFAGALYAEGLAAPDGIARMLASRYQLPFVDLPTVGVSEPAAQTIPLRVLARAIAVPSWLEGDRALEDA